MIPIAVHQEILRRLESAAREHAVRILLAVESGSRAWGFASENSDYDVRFIYAHPRDWYVAVDLEERRDVIEYPIVDDIDLNGWDVRKALRLFARSNPAFVEWLQSPIRYMVNGGFAAGAEALMETVYTPEKGVYHYRSMANTNYRDYLKGETVPLKKYFYVLRPLLAVKWIELHQKAPPIEFETLLSLVDDADLLAEIHALLERKKASVEKELVPPIKRLNDFIEAELARLEGFRAGPSLERAGMQQLNALFQTVLDEAWD